MVSKKELLNKISSLEQENTRLTQENIELKTKQEVNENCEKRITLFFNALRAINKKLNSHIKDENNDKKDDDKVQKWLKDDRIDEIQDFLNKGAK